MKKIRMEKTIKEMTLYELDDFTWKEYEKENDEVEVILKRPNYKYEIHQVQHNGNEGCTNVILDSAFISINWQASGALIDVDYATPEALYFLKKEIVEVSTRSLLDVYYRVNDGEELDDFIKNNEDGDIFNTLLANENTRKQKHNNKISLEDFIETHPEHKHLYENMRERYNVKHTVNAWIKLAKNSEERNKMPETKTNVDLRYYLKFKSISKEAASLFNEYLDKVKELSGLNYVYDKDIQDYTITVIRNALNDYVGVSYNVDREAFVEICKLKKDEFEKNRLDILKDVKDKVVKHFEDIGFTLSERNLNSIEWWVLNYKIYY